MMTKIVNFIIPGAGILVLGFGNISNSENAFFLQIFSSLLRDIDQTNEVYSNDDHGRVYLNC